MRKLTETEGATCEAVFTGAATANTVKITPFVSAKLFATCVVTCDGVNGIVCSDPECEPCNDLLHAWWTMSNEMDRRDRVEMQALLRRAGIDLPPAPWEEEPA